MGDVTNANANVTNTNEPDLRDLFASKALPMLIDIGHNEDWSPAHIAEMAYHYADAMLTARSKGE